MCEKTIDDFLNENKCDCCCGCNNYHYEDNEDDWDEFDVIDALNRHEVDPMISLEMGHLDPIVAENALTSEQARDIAEMSSKDNVKLINVNKTVSNILVDIYDDIVDNADKRVLSYNLRDTWNELLDRVRDVTLNKVLTRTAKHLYLNGFEVKTRILEDEDDDAIYELSFRLVVIFIVLGF